jgi:Na+-transporting NADH:ubiquinone oxidoreductase subunit C
MADEHPLKPFYSVLVLAFACSAMVAVAAVGLRPYQEANRSLDRKKNILAAAGIYRADQPIAEQFAAVQTRLVNLSKGRFVEPGTIDPATYNQLSDDKGEALTAGEDIAGIKRLEKYSLIYLVRDKGRVQSVVVPVRGKGLWSTMYAYVAVDADLNTIRGISFYEQGETPGLGGEVANPKWQAGWQRKKLYGPNGSVKLQLVKNSANSSPEDLPYRVDGLSGATLTTKGVDNLMQFWFGDNGFKRFFDHIRQQGGFNG